MPSTTQSSGFAATLTGLYYTGKVSLNKIVQLMSVNPRKLLGLEYISIKPNETADLVIADLNKEWTVEPQMLHSKSKNTVFKGMKLKGKPIMTLSKGEIKYKEM